MRRSRSPASSCCTAFGRDSSDCHLSAFKVELHLQSGTRCFRPELCAAKQECLLVMAICTRAVFVLHEHVAIADQSEVRQGNERHVAASSVDLLQLSCADGGGLWRRE